MALEHKSAAGIFLAREHTEAAIAQLKNSGFSMDKVSVVAQNVSRDDKVVTSESEFARHKTLERLERGALDGGTLGGVSGLLMGGLGTLVIPGVGSIVLAGALVGMFAGGYYGTVAGGLLGVAIVSSISPEQAKVYTDSLAQGHYLVVVESTDEEISRAESVLKAQGIQDWSVYSTL